MAVKRKSAKRSKKTEVEEMTSYTNQNPLVETKPRNTRVIKIAVGVVFLAIILGLLARRYKSIFLVGSVNNVPILRNELNQRLVDRFGTQMLEALIGERLITQAAAKENIVVTDAEVSTRISEIEKTISGGMTLADTLKLQGITQKEFESQVRIQLMIDKMFAKDISVSAAEIDDFVKTNGSVLTATEAAAKRDQAEKEVRNQKISSKFVEWFNKLKEEAKIERYL